MVWSGGAWQRSAQERSEQKITISDLIVKLTAAALCLHPRLNARWDDGAISLNDAINIGLAVAVEDGLELFERHLTDAGV